MKSTVIDWSKVALFWLGFAVAGVLFDFLMKGRVDTAGVIGIPTIAIGLVYLIDKKRFMKKE
ncbi:MAG: hypothetical protein AAF960_09930 [Bacteroidota bacterium]